MYPIKQYCQNISNERPIILLRQPSLHNIYVKIKLQAIRRSTEMNNKYRLFFPNYLKDSLYQVLYPGNSMILTDSNHDISTIYLQMYDITENKYVNQLEPWNADIQITTYASN